MASSVFTGRTIKVVLLGLGNVGRALVGQILKAKQYHHTRYALQFEFSALIDSSGAVSNGPLKSSLTDAVVVNALSHKESGLKLSAHASAFTDSDVASLLRSIVDQHTIVIDCSATATSAELLISSLAQGAGVTMANKKPLTLAQSVFDRMNAAAGRSRLRYESTCGAGTPMITALRRLLDAHDLPHTIEGTFSGTLGYLTTGLQEGNSYSAVVLEAARLGYTEPDPRDDLGGVDVARKALILARTCGVAVEMSDITIEALFPSHFAALSIPEFMAALPQLDADYAARNAEAQAAGKVLRYVATITPAADGNSNSTLSVGLKALSNSSPIGLLSGTENMIEFHTPIYSPKPLVVRGFGAGGEVTAAGVLADMIELADILAPQQQAKL